MVFSRKNSKRNGDSSEGPLSNKRLSNETARDEGNSSVEEDEEALWSNEDDSSHDIRENYGMTNGVHRNDVREVKKLVRQEHLQVQCWRCVVLVTLVISAIAITSMTVTSLKRENDEDFVSAYHLFSQTIRTALSSRLNDGVFQHHYDLCNRLTEFAIATNSEWPFVTLPGFPSVNESLAEHIQFAPLIQGNQQVSSWNSYSVQNINKILSEEQSAQISPYIFNIVERKDVQGVVKNINERETGENNDIAAPCWQFSPLSDASSMLWTLNYNAMNQSWFRDAYQAVSRSRRAVLLSANQAKAAMLTEGSYMTNATSIRRAASIHPIFARLDDASSDIVGLLTAVWLPWDHYLQNIPLLPPDDVNIKNANMRIVCVVENSCGEIFTYQLHAGGQYVEFMGDGDLHDPEYHSMREVVLDSMPPLLPTDRSVPGECTYRIIIYPTTPLADEYWSKKPFTLGFVVAMIFALLTLIFFIYEGLLQRKNSKIMSAAAQFNKVVSSLFPSNLRGRLFGVDDDNYEPTTGLPTTAGITGKLRDDLKKLESRTRTLKAYLNIQSKRNLNSGSEDKDEDDDSDDDDEEVDRLMYKSKPIADLYTDTTVMFADIVGFTAWSSVREPSQVFALLETIYNAFDQIARRRGVFKVETVGDCYVAVAGLPDPRPDHAVVMARFAQECLVKMKKLAHKLEVRLGPDTGDLSMRAGLHSGPVTAGVLRGERSRFQLFGDTMNTASRMESMGRRDCVHVSQETADLLKQAGKDRWLFKREDTVVAKGKGELQTYWLDIEGSGPSGNASVTRRADGRFVMSRTASLLMMSADCDEQVKRMLHSEKTTRLIHWNVEVLKSMLKQIVARRSSHGLPGTLQHVIQQTRRMSLRNMSVNGTVLDEVKEVIEFPNFDRNVKEVNPRSVTLSREVEDQLYRYVVSIAAMYRENPFHNFDHASHVTMSVTKLLSRIVAPPADDEEENGRRREDHTYGITSDPITQFACIFSALIHDVDHTGVPNAQLIKEKTDMAAAYNNKAVAEQNSVDLAWTLLMDEQYAELWNTICATPADKQRFRQLVVNSVMATDIIDKDLKQLRNLRWEKAFSRQNNGARLSAQEERENIHRKATIVIEHLIQASDVAHTMQHWHIYRKWNARLFREMSLAYHAGRSASDPASNWYEGELGFFDFYIIPLARKLKDCGVFGVSSDEYLNYALKNREEWERRGKDVVADMVESFNKVSGQGKPNGDMR